MKKNVNIIYNILNGIDVKEEDKKDWVYNHYMSLFYHLNNDIPNAKKHALLLLNIESVKLNPVCMNRYASILETEGNFEEAKKYYLIGINKGYKFSMSYYARLMKTQGNISEAKKYYLMAIENGHITSMNNYGVILENEGNISEAKKYYLMAIDNGKKESLKNYAHLLRKDQPKEAIKYYYKYFEKTNDKTVLNHILSLLKTEEMAIVIGQSLINEWELETKVKDLQNFKNAVNDMGPMNALVLGYI